MLGVGSGIGGVSSSKRMNMSSCRHHALADPARWGPCEDLQGEQPAIMPRVTSWEDEGMTMAAASSTAALSLPADTRPVEDLRGPLASLGLIMPSGADEGVTVAASPAYIPVPYEKPRRGPVASPSLILPRAVAWPAVVSEGVTAAAASAPVSDGPSNTIVQISCVGPWPHLCDT